MSGMFMTDDQSTLFYGAVLLVALLSWRIFKFPIIYLTLIILLLSVIAIVGIYKNSISMSIKVQGNEDDEMSLVGPKEGIYFLISSSDCQELKKINYRNVVYELTKISNSKESPRCCVIRQCNILNKPVGNNIKINITEARLMFDNGSFNHTSSPGFIISTNLSDEDALKIKCRLKQPNTYWKSIRTKYNKLYMTICYRKYPLNIEEMCSSILMREIYPGGGSSTSGTSENSVFVYEILLNELFKSFPVSSSNESDNVEEIINWCNQPDGKLAVYLSNRFISIFNTSRNNYIPPISRKLMYDRMKFLKNYAQPLYDYDAWILLNAKVNDILCSMDSSFFSYSTIHEYYMLKNRFELSTLISKDLESNPNAEMLKCIFAIASYQYEGDSCHKANEFVKDLLFRKGYDIQRIYHAMDHDILRINLILSSDITFGALFEELKMNNENSKKYLVDAARKYIARKYAPEIKLYCDQEEEIVMGTKEMTLIFGNQKKEEGRMEDQVNITNFTSSSSFYNASISM